MSAKANGDGDWLSAYKFDNYSHECLKVNRIMRIYWTGYYHCGHLLGKHHFWMIDDFQQLINDQQQRYYEAQ